ncbi:type IV secretion protein Rhs [Chryseobacterium sp. WG14]|uniref:RHS repeat-associated core domain-containing protein n=1 Tax=Chryseobacterium sp. WG14 TaxID=2926909 RepID=UPI00211F0799|nr:RHS repeat-associated core domain-containing protein [Chryseobacterium sp. WG14]MCQ9638970.1 type IV secretion protein Rhs [Chryseobacterium sp. WG14]
MKKYYHKKIQLFSSLILSFISVFCFSQNFHDTKGDIEVTRAGQFQFSLPIDVPPGIKSVTPNINLVYTSESGNGMVGYGWSISGISAIKRIEKNIDNAEEVKGIQLSYSDYYSYNGQRLILKSGEYGRDGAEYVTEKYSNIKIKSVGAVSGQPWQGPEYWEVTFEDGSQALYGQDAGTSTEYNIIEWRDPQGNYITYLYEQGYGVTKITGIRWGGNKDLNTPHINTIRFNYKDRDLKEESYIQGLKYYQTKILTEIKVFANDTPFKRYTIEYTGNGTNYEFANKITEYNANNEPANPVMINYPAMENSSYAEYVAESDPFDNVKLVGDFNGDSYLDFLMNNGTVKLGAFNETFSTISTGQVFGANAKLVSTLLDEEGQIYNGNGVVEYKNGKVLGYILRNNAFVKVFERNLYITCSPTCDDNLTLDVGDIDGNGIPDLFIRDNAPIGFQTVYLVDLKSPSSPYGTVVTALNENSYPDQKYMDVDGDGKVEIISVWGSQYAVLEFVKSNTPYLQYEKKIRFSGLLLETKDQEFPILYGDYNGDGKLDFTIPITDYAVGKADDWRFYMGTDKGFAPFLKKEFFTYRKFQKEITGNYAKFAKQYFFSVTDMNKDGKSDVVQVFSYNQINPLYANGYRDFGYVISAKMANGSQADGTPNFTPNWLFQSPVYGTSDILDLTLFSPLTSPIKSGNNYYNVFLYWKQYLKKIKGPTPLSELARISSITQGGVTTSVKYLEMIPDNTTNPSFYRKEKKAFYPYYSLSRADQLYAVSQLQQEDRKQDFRYRGLTGNLQGKKIIGYHQTAQSSWYADGFENTKIWSGSEIDLLIDGAPVKEWSIRTNSENDIFPADISENNTQLLSFESVAYKTNKLLNGQVITSVPLADKSKVVTATVPNFTRTKDFLTGKFIQKVTTYENYYLPSRLEVSTDYGYGVSITDFNYEHNIGGTGKNYYVGRPTNKIETTEAYGDTQHTFTSYAYENNLLKTSRFFPGNNATHAIVEEYSYDGFGNIIAKKTTAGIDGNSKTEKDEYDPAGRFLIKKTDNLGLETKITYNDWGQVLSQTDPDGNTLTNTYDAWGKQVSEASSLLGTTTYQYEKDNLYNITIIRNDPDGDVSRIFTNKLGQEYKTSAKAFGQGQYVSKEALYDILGRKIKESEPYFEGQTASQWNTFMYDDTVFPAKVKATAFTGKQTETTVSGLTTTVKETSPADYGRTTSQTMDALGNVISSTDKGGTVDFSYNAAGQQIHAQYANNMITTNYDEWGNKIEMVDPSTGTYLYEYQGYMGALSKIISPKGEKRYTYNSLGQLIRQEEQSTTGNDTDKKIAFVYNNKGRLILKEGSSNGKQYAYTIKYDPQGRVTSSAQKSPEASFYDKNITYDGNGRVISYKKEITSLGGITNASIENLYSPWNGELYQVKDQISGKVLWELKQTNARAQVLKAMLGTSEVNNTYNDATGMIREINHLNYVGEPLVNIQYNFNAIKNELISRKVLGNFNIIETFDYDDNNRLINWTNPVTGIKPTSSRNIYDVKGRILKNDQIGKVLFENPDNAYQSTGMSLNTEGVNNYNDDLIQHIAYNENNDPVFVEGQKGNVAFRYGLTAMRQRVTYGGNFSSGGDGKFTKLYSEEGSFEVVKDNTTGKEKHIIYIGGSPYDSDIVYLKSFEATNGSYMLLHKDYLGSILAISSLSGKPLERRHFDAWGNLTHLQLAGGLVITDKKKLKTTSLLIDRGYTGHEYFPEIGIIHMNGRLYDPLLRRFLNADENIQAPFNTQNYNRYGYVMNNPLMYNDPNGEFVWILAGAVIGAYFTGVKANGSWNPTKWDWGATWGKIAMGGAIGAFTGGVGAAVGASAATAAATTWGISGGVLGGAISGASGGAVAGAINGFATSVMFGEDVIEGTVMGGLSGAALGGAIGGAAGGIQQIVKNVQAANIGAPQQTILKGATIAEGRSAWTLNNTPKTTTVGVTLGKTTPVIIGDVEGGILESAGNKFVNEQPVPIFKEGPKTIYKGEYISKTEMVQVRHHTSFTALKGIKKSGLINASRGEPYGVDVEVSPFVKASKVDLGQYGSGSYIEFSVPKIQVGPPASKGIGGIGNAGRIVTGGAPLKISGSAPKFVRWNWLGF